MALNSYDRECLLIGYVMNFEEASRIVLPELTHNKFIYSMTGAFGPAYDHSLIWQAIEVCVLASKQMPTLVGIVSHLPARIDRDEFHAYLQVIKDKFSNYYGETDFDRRRVEELATLVDAAGILFNISGVSQEIGNITQERELFDAALSSIPNIDVWVNEVIQKYRSKVTSKQEGYTPLTTVVEEAHERLAAIERGENIFLISPGIPIVRKSLLSPLRSLMVLHGMSGAGKSAFQTALLIGAAMTLVANDVQGCVAFNSLEMDRLDFLFRASAMISGFDTTKLKQGPGALKGEDYQNFKRWMEIVGQLPVFIDDTNFITTSGLDFRLDSLHSSEHGPVWQLGVDYIELLKDVSDSSKEQVLDMMIHNLFQTSRTTGANVMVISQSTYGEGTANRFKIAGPSGTRYSKAIQHAADVVLELWNPVYMETAGIDFQTPDKLDENHIWILVQKYRGGPVGTNFRLGWKPEYTRIWDTSAGGIFDASDVIYEHLEQVESILAGRKLLVAPPEDTDFGSSF